MSKRTINPFKSTTKRTGEKLANKIAREKSIEHMIKEHLDQDKKIRIRMGYAYIIAMAETEGVNLNPDQIKAVIDTMSNVMVDYNKTKEEDGADVAEVKLYQKVREVFGDSDARNRFDFETLFTPYKEKSPEEVTVKFHYIDSGVVHKDVNIVEGLKYDLGANIDPGTGFIIYKNESGDWYMIPRVIASESPDRQFNKETDFIFTTEDDVDCDRWPMDVIEVKHE